MQLFISHASEDKASPAGCTTVTVVRVTLSKRLRFGSTRRSEFQGKTSSAWGAIRYGRDWRDEIESAAARGDACMLFFLSASSMRKLKSGRKGRGELFWELEQGLSNKHRFLGTESGITFPAWKAVALFGSGVELSSASLGLLRRFGDEPAKAFTLTAPGFEGIAAVRFESDPNLDGAPVRRFQRDYHQGAEAQTGADRLHAAEEAPGVPMAQQTVPSPVGRELTRLQQLNAVWRTPLTSPSLKRPLNLRGFIVACVSPPF